jgi:hypothetical protein
MVNAGSVRDVQFATWLTEARLVTSAVPYGTIETATAAVTRFVSLEGIIIHSKLKSGKRVRVYTVEEIEGAKIFQ